MRFSLIDKITEIDSGKSLTAIKNLSLAEEYLQDHFPGFPVMPGVLQVEALVQSCAWLMRVSEDFRYSTVLLQEAKAVKFNSFVKPGDTMLIHVQVQKQNADLWTFKASAEVGETTVISARLTLRQSNQADDKPHLAASDATQIDGMQKLYGELYHA